MSRSSHPSGCVTRMQRATSFPSGASTHRRDLLGRMTGTPAAQKLVKAQQKLADEDLRRPLRIRGHLFFDASHRLCNGTSPTQGNPPRRSGWQIHPVYSIDVYEFTTLTTCRVDRERCGRHSRNGYRRAARPESVEELC